MAKVKAEEMLHQFLHRLRPKSSCEKGSKRGYELTAEAVMAANEDHDRCPVCSGLDIVTKPPYTTSSPVKTKLHVDKTCQMCGAVWDTVYVFESARLTLDPTLLH